MKTFIMTADCMPKNARNWFSGFNEGMEFEAESLELAQEWLEDEGRIDQIGQNGEHYQ